MLAVAWQDVRRNGRAAGVDGQTVADIEAYGVDRWLGELARDLKEGTYRPEAARHSRRENVRRIRVAIPRTGEPIAIAASRAFSIMVGRPFATAVRAERASSAIRLHQVHGHSRAGRLSRMDEPHDAIRLMPLESLAQEST